MPKIVDREQYRRELLQGAFELFAEIGYGKIAMRQLAQGLGVSTGTLYHYFPSKEEIFLQIVAEQTQQDIANFLAHAESIGPDVRSRVRAILDFVKADLDYFLKQMKIGMDYYQHQGQKEGGEIKPIFQEVDRETIQAIDNYLQVNNYAIAEFILTFISGLLWSQIFLPNPDMWERQANLLVEIVENQLTNLCLK